MRALFSSLHRALARCFSRGAARPGGRAAVRGTGERGRAGRPHRLLGDRRHRRLALPDGDAGEGRSSERAAERRGQRAREHLGSGEGRGRRRQCKAYGAAGVMRVPGRLHITWQDDTTLKIETEAGTQTRLLRFGPVRHRRQTRPRCRASRPRTWEFAGAPRRPRRGRAARRAQGGQPEGRDDPHAAWLPAEERRALRRERRADGVLQPHGRTKRRLVADPHGDRRGPAVPDRPVRPQHALQDDCRTTTRPGNRNLQCSMIESAVAVGSPASREALRRDSP